MHRFLLHNGEICQTTEALVSPGQVGYMNGWGVFSTLRVEEGVLFEYARHYNRMNRDAELMRVPMEMTAETLEEDLLALIEANRAENATLRVAVVRNRGNLFESPNINRETDVVAFTAPLKAWGAGVKLAYVANGRHAGSPFAGTKVTSWIQNLTWHEEAQERGLDEYILLNEHGQVSECTSANIFAVQGPNIFTPPLRTSGCLPGITRALLLEEVSIPGMSVRERDLTPAELESSGQIFITSTTRDVLPVLEIEGKPMQQSPAVFGLVQQAFREYRRAYIQAHTRRREVFAG